MQPQQPQQNAPQYTAASQRKGTNLTFIGLVVSIVLLLGAIGFGVWAFAERHDYKNNVDQKIQAAVTVAEQEQQSRLETEFLEREKSPVKTYKGPSAYGSVSFEYPKTWSGYVIEKDRGSEQIDGYFFPHIVPDVKSETAYALRVQVVDKQYADVVKSYSSDVKSGDLKLKAYQAPNVENVAGSRIVGEVETGKRGELIVLPLRDKTLLIWTESKDFNKDFNKIVLKSLTFVP